MLTIHFIANKSKNQKPKQIEPKIKKTNKQNQNTKQNK